MTDEDDKAIEPLHIPYKALESLQSVNSWFFDVFNFAKETNNEPMKYLAHYLFNRYDLFRKFLISPKVLNNFITAIEIGYKKYNNPYHNNIHGADVTQTLNAILCETRLIEWLTDLEIFACLLAAMIHDYDHTGNTNSFHVATSSERAMIYNDRSVQENYHISASFKLLKEDKYNILKNLSHEDYQQMRGLIVDLILATDIAFHFQLLKEVKNQMNTTKSSATMSKSRALALVLHAADISNSFKLYSLHLKWTDLIMQEFFAQGDLERDLDLPISPLCDRNNIYVPEAQLNFMEFVVKPTFDVVVEMVYFVLRRKHINKNQIKTPWVELFEDNKKKWREQIYRDHRSPLSKRRSSVF